MASESITFSFLSQGADKLAGDFKKTGDNAGLAAKGAKVLQDAIKQLGDKENRTAAESANLARALRLTGDAEDRAAAKALAAEIAISRLDESMKKSSASTGSARGAFLGLAGEITGFGAASDAASSKSTLFARGLAGLNLASGVLEPALAGVVVAAGGIAAAYASAGIGLGVFGAVASSVLSQASSAATKYTAAQTKLNTATTSKQRTAALQAEKNALYGLDTAQKSVVFSIIGAQNAWHGFTRAATPGVAKVLAAAIKLLPEAFALLKPFLAPVESALTGIIGAMKTGIAPGSQFSKIMHDFAASSGTTLSLALRSAGNLFVGLLGVLHAFLPEGVKLITWVEQATVKFREWGTTLSSHTGFQSLMQTFRTETPQAVTILKNLGVVLLNVGKAMFGLSTFSNSKVLLQALLPLSGVLASLSKNQGLTRIALYLLAATVAARKLGPAFLGIKAAIAFFPNAWQAIAKFAAVTEGATVAETIAAAATRAWGLAMDALPWVALAAAVVAVALLIIKYHTQIWHFMQRVWGDILGIISGVWHWIQRNWPLLLGIITGPVGLAVLWIVQHFGTITGAVKTVLRAVQTAWNATWSVLRAAFRIFIVDYVLTPLGWIIHAAAAAFGWVPGLGGKLQGAAKAFDTFRANVNKALGGISGRTVNVSVAMTSSTNPYPGGISGRKASGGQITGPGGPRSDTAGLYALSNGEWVVQASSSAKYGAPAMDAVNRGTAVIGYASGGGVGVNVSAHTPAVAQIESSLLASVTRLAQAFAKAAAAVSVPSYKPGAGVAQWRGVVQQALGLAGANVAQLTDPVLYQMSTESGGNPTIVNRTDSNWFAGHPSVGLMQVIRGTYAQYAGQFRNTGPFEYGVSVNPLANIYAAIKYAQANYGPGLRNAYGGIGTGHGYDRGGWLPTGTSIAVNNTGRPEQVIPPGGTAAGGAVHLHLTVNGPIGSQSQLEDWFIRTANKTARHGRLSQAVKAASR